MVVDITRVSNGGTARSDWTVAIAVDSAAIVGYLSLFFEVLGVDETLH